MLIDTHDQPPEPPPDRAPRQWPVRALLLIAEAIVMFALSFAFPPLPAYILLLGSCVLFGRGLSRLVPTSNGLKNYRQ